MTDSAPPRSNSPPVFDVQCAAGERAALIRNKALLAGRAWASSERSPSWLERFFGRGKRRSGRHVSGTDISDCIEGVQARHPEFTFGQASARSERADEPLRRCARIGTGRL